MSYTDRVVVLVDMDCFYCQVEENLNPDLKGKPLAVVQYNAWRGGGTIAVNYPARKRGVTRHMRGDQAKQKCPDIELVRVPSIRGKADLSKYRDAGKSVAKVLQTFTPLLERASVDEAYLDITEAVNERMRCAVKEIALSQIRNTHVVGCDSMDFLYGLYNSSLQMESNLKLAYGGVIAEEMRAVVFEQTGYTCSAGVAHNKILAKLTCGLNKPNKQTILPQDSVEGLYKDLPVQKIRSLGGKFGNSLSEELGIKFMADLLKFSEKELKKHYDEKTGYACTRCSLTRITYKFLQKHSAIKHPNLPEDIQPLPRDRKIEDWVQTLLLVQRRLISDNESLVSGTTPGDQMKNKSCSVQSVTSLNRSGSNSVDDISSTSSAFGVDSSTSKGQLDQRQHCSSKYKAASNMRDMEGKK